MFSLDDLLTRLAHERPVFHTEADFQHALGWALHVTHPDWSVRLERRVQIDGLPAYVDLLAFSTHDSLAIELKYKTRKTNVEREGEVFELKGQGAQDLGRYDFINDICRLESVASECPGTRGCALFLANDPLYWCTAPAGAPVDAAFRLLPGRILSGRLTWHPGASEGTLQGRASALALRHSYRVAWRGYSEVDCPLYGTFKYLAIEVPASTPGV
jgi:hypothetical protein